MCNKYFATVGTSLANNILNKVGKTELELASLAKSSESPNQSFFLYPTDQNEISKYIMQLRNNSAPGLDRIRNQLMKSIVKHISIPLSHICNLSLSSGCFPDAWKAAVITPIHKSGDKTSPSNYRPISLLSVVSKVLEKVVNTRLVKYLESNKLLSPSQFGFRQGFSTEQAVSLLLDKVTTQLDQGKSCLGVFLDLAKAFDTVSVPILLQKMENIGVRGLPLDWFRSYLSDRQQQTRIRESISDPLKSVLAYHRVAYLAPHCLLSTLTK